MLFLGLIALIETRDGRSGVGRGSNGGLSGGSVRLVEGVEGED